MKAGGYVRYARDVVRCPLCSVAAAAVAEWRAVRCGCLRGGIAVKSGMAIETRGQGRMVKYEGRMVKYVRR